MSASTAATGSLSLRMHANKGSRVSQSKAEALRRVSELEQRLAQAERNTVYLLQVLMDIHDEHPHIELPDLGQRFSDSTWMAVRT